MAPEFNSGVARRIISGQLEPSGKFVRQGNSIWVEPNTSMRHRVLANNVGFTHVEDAGLFICISDTEIAFLGSSTDFHKDRNGPDRDETIQAAERAVGDSARIIKL